MNEIRFSQYVIYNKELDKVFFKPLPNPTRKPFEAEVKIENVKQK